MSVVVSPRSARSARRPIAIALACALTFGVVAEPGVAGADTLNPTFRAITGVGSDTTQANITWRSNSKVKEHVRIAKATGPENFRLVEAEDWDKGASYRSLTAVVTDLEPATAYMYQVGSDEAGWSGTHLFTTDAGEKSWRFLVFSDPQVGVNLGVEEQGYQWRDAIGNATLKYPDPSFLMVLGDQVEGWGDTVAQYNEFFSPEQIRAFQTGVIKGNHETYPLPGPSEQHFAEHYNLPNDNGDHDYYFERGNVLFIALNSNLSSKQDLEKHAAFIRKTVSDHGENKDWIIAMMHHSLYSNGGRYNDSGIVRMRNTLGPVFSEVGVDLVLSGHDHMHNRSHLINGVDARIPDKLAEPGDVLAPKKGEVLYVTTSTAGGGKFYNFEDKSKYKGLTIEEAREQGLGQSTIAYWNQDYTTDYGVVEVSPDKLTVRTHNVYSDQLVDEVTLTHRTNKPSDAPAPSTTPATPTVTVTTTQTETATATETVTTGATATETVTTGAEPTATVTATQTATATATETATQTVTATSVQQTVTATATETATVTETATTTATATATQAAPVTETATVTATETSTQAAAPATVTVTKTAVESPADGSANNTADTGSSTGSIIALVLSAIFAILGVLAFNVDAIRGVAAQFGIFF